MVHNNNTRNNSHHILCQQLKIPFTSSNSRGEDGNAVPVLSTSSVQFEFHKFHRQYTTVYFRPSTLTDVTDKTYKVIITIRFQLEFPGTKSWQWQLIRNIHCSFAQELKVRISVVPEKCVCGVISTKMDSDCAFPVTQLSSGQGMKIIHLTKETRNCCWLLTKVVQYFANARTKEIHFSKGQRWAFLLF